MVPHDLDLTLPKELVRTYSTSGPYSVQTLLPSEGIRASSQEDLLVLWLWGEVCRSGTGANATLVSSGLNGNGAEGTGGDVEEQIASWKRTLQQIPPEMTLEVHGYVMFYEDNPASLEAIISFWKTACGERRGRSFLVVGNKQTANLAISSVTALKITSDPAQNASNMQILQSRVHAYFRSCVVMFSRADIEVLQSADLSASIRRASDDAYERINMD